jgi:ankyrin repeat protein
MKTKELNVAMRWHSVDGHLEIVKLLLDKGADVNDRDKSRSSPHMVNAVHGGHEELVQLFLESGLDVKTDKHGQLLLTAAKEGYLDISKMLIDYGAPVDAQGRKGNTPLILASRCYSREITACLLDRNADIEVANEKEQRPLHAAVKSGDLGLARVILENNPSIGARLADGNTALHIAASTGQVIMVVILLDGADVEAQDHLGKTPLDVAIESKQHGAETRLRRRGARSFHRPPRRLNPAPLSLKLVRLRSAPR